MNILILTEYFPETIKKEITGGVESRAFYIAKELSKKHDVIILTSWHKGLERISNFNFSDFGFKVYRIGNHHPYTSKPAFFSRLDFASNLVNEAIKFKNIDIIDVYNFTTYLPGYKIAKKLKKKVIATYHETWINEWIKNKGLLAFPYELYERLILKLNYDAFISVSNYTKKRLIKNGLDEKKIFVCPNGVDLKKFDSIKATKEKNPTIIYVGRLIKTKNVDVLIKAISLVKKEINNIKLKIIGEGQEKKNLETLTKKLDLTNNISFLGHLKSHDLVLKEIKSSHIFCSASTLEGFGIVLLEAMVLKIPYICTDIEPFKEINNQKGGLFFKPKNDNELAEKILLLLNNKEIYKKKIAELDDLSKYDWKNIALKIENIYKEILKNR